MRRIGEDSMISSASFHVASGISLVSYSQRKLSDVVDLLVKYRVSVAQSKRPRRLAAVVFLTVLTGLTVLTADRMDTVDVIDVVVQTAQPVNPVNNLNSQPR